MPQEQFLYRFYNVEDDLIYVGITDSWHRRFHQHEKQSGWFSHVAKVTFEKYPDRQSVAKAELEIIKSERPTYNRASNPDYETVIEHAQKIKGWVYGRSLDEQHMPMERYLIWAREKFGWSRKNAKSASLIWFQAFAYAIEEIAFECRNCTAYTQHSVYEHLAYSRILEIAKDKAK